MKNNKIILSLVGLLFVGGGLLFALSFRETDHASNSNMTALAATVYYQPNCGCCKEYIKYLERNGFSVERKQISPEELSGVKEDLGVPREVAACHTMKIGDYFIEGHVPVEAIEKLMSEKPAIDGIALSGMPMGSPGMTGFKTGPLRIQSVFEGKVTGLFVEE